MRPRPAPRHRLVIGTTLLAFWLGWVCMAMAGLQPDWQGEPAAAGRALASALAQLPGDAGQGPLAIRLHADGAGDDAWQALAAGIDGQAGRALVLDLGTEAAGFEVLVLAAGLRPVYAGPLVPDPALCGGHRAPATRLSQWLPQLLARTGSPLLISPSRRLP